MEARGQLILLSDRIAERADKLRHRKGPPATGAVAPVPSARGWRAVVLPLFIVAALTFAAALAAVHGPGGRAQLLGLPADIRAALHERTLGEVASLCIQRAARASGELRDHCVSQARFLLSFPECDAACRASAAEVLPHSRR
jgi:hypothetical protein